MRGMVTRAVLLAEGWTDVSIRKAIGGKELRRLWPGVYTDQPRGKPWDEYRLTVLAAGLVGGHGVTSHQSAGAIHRLAMLDPDCARVHTTVSAKHGGGLVSANRHVHPRLLRPEDSVVIDGLIVTSRTRTVIDIALSGTFEQAAVVVNGARRRYRYPTASTPVPIPVAELHAALDFLSGAARSAIARRAIVESSELCESPGETLSLLRMRQWRLPEPQQQRAFRINGRTYYVDFLWGTLVGEFDGDDKYDSDAARRRYEKRRDGDFATIGYTVCHWSWEDLQDRPRFFRILTNALVRSGQLSYVPAFAG
ncbi:hypothetical protein FK268_04745 [Tsukamurella sputi]|uniref:Type IV toxin-antitoxin system AbiEi family antitoxin domain-containing protein n=1 Tax=Tsukamurella sputi TaxID=2591848 RepID=A0A5C5RTZ8_9ACTN|nr:hypothetical protein [Tsukamurella sputi]TWS26536.1 hypothetical protein FK268_04745 [Tsukamurella sputi]